jgi:hypothetical protein
MCMSRAQVSTKCGLMMNIAVSTLATTARII